jgi:hypothetical protein
MSARAPSAAMARAALAAWRTGRRPTGDPDLSGQDFRTEFNTDAKIIAIVRSRNVGGGLGS